MTSAAFVQNNITSPDADVSSFGQQNISGEDDELLDAYSRTIAAVVNRVAPSVVNIRVTTSDRPLGGGSGFLITRDGFIITNSHVVAGARELEVTVHDGRTYSAAVVGTDAETDLAVIRIDAPDLQHARLADSSTIRVGQIAIADHLPMATRVCEVAMRIDPLGHLRFDRRRKHLLGTLAKQLGECVMARR